MCAAGQCSDYAMKTPARGSKICNGTSDYNECVVSCPTGYVFYNLKNPSKFICSSSSPTFALSTDPTVTYVPDCMRKCFFINNLIKFIYFLALNCFITIFQFKYKLYATLAYLFLMSLCKYVRACVRVCVCVQQICTHQYYMHTSI